MKRLRVDYASIVRLQGKDLRYIQRRVTGKEHTKMLVYVKNTRQARNLLLKRR
jgi:hypothetical protein